MTSLPWYLALWGSPTGTARRLGWLRRVFSLLTLVLLGATWQLWVPQQAFPQVPLLTDAEATPWLFQVGSLALATLGLFSALLDRDAGRFWRAGLLVFAGSMFMLWVFDQHRLQPWAYQALLLALVLATVEPVRGVALLRLFTVSIYVYSAISKLDYTFLHSLGQQFTHALWNLVGSNSNDWTESQRVFATFLFPLGELAVALLLSLPRTRQLGFAAAIGMHLLLIVVLQGMHQQPAVLVWNLEFILLVGLLFGGRWQQSADTENSAAKSSSSEKVPRRRSWASLMAEGLLWAAMFAPLLEPFGWCDHWLAWGLYSPGASRAQVFVRGSDVPDLPSEWQSYVEQGDEGVVWRRVYLDRWSLETLHAPLYPQARFQLGVAMAVANALPPGRDVRVELFSPADRFTGERNQTSLLTRSQFDEAVRAYWVNAIPAE